MREAPLVSVVVPVRDGERDLPALLDGLAAQTLARERFEVVLVDDGSRDGTAALAREWARAGPARRRVVAGPGRGPAAARNAGVRTARGAWVASTDADVRPAPTWLEAALAAAERTGAQAVEGAIEPLAAERAGVRALVQRNPDGGRFMTANMLYRRDLLERLGGFSERFGCWFEDSDVAFRILDAGLEIPFAPEARVAHPTVVLGVREVARKTRWLVWLPSFARAHPERYASQLRPHLRPLYGTDSDVLVGLAAGAAAVAARGAPRAVLLGVAAHGLRRGLVASGAFDGPAAHRPGRAALGVGLPVLKASLWALGSLRDRVGRR